MALTKIRQEQGVVINDGSTDVDFRVESDTSTHALFVQGSDGNVGIGTSSPSTPSGSCLSLYNATLPRLNFKNSTTGDGTADGFELYMQGTLAGVNNKENGAIAFGTNDSERMRIDSSGNVGIGLANPSDYYAKDLVVAAADEGGITLECGTAEKAYLMFADGTSGAAAYAGYIGYDHNIGALNIVSSGYMNFYTGPSQTEYMRIDANGNLMVGQTSISQTAVGFSATQGGIVSTAMASALSSSNTYHVYSTGASAYRFYVGMHGTVFATTTTISAISDVRYKENIRDLDDGLSKIMALQPRKFDWKEGKGRDVKDDRGWIAQEIETVFPDLVDEWLDESPEGEEPYKSVRPDLIPVLVKAMQELSAKNDALEARITALE